jgi:hypothetical protein
MSHVYLIKPLHKKSICWHIEMFRDNADGSISWFNIDDHYRWGQGFVEEDMDCNLPLEGDLQAHAKMDCGWGAELDDQHACWFEFSDDITEEEQERIKKCYLEGDGDLEWERAGAAWLYEGNHEWQFEDDYLVIDAPYQVSLCEDDGTVIEENVKLRTREELAEAAKKWQESNTNKWPFDAVESEGGEID